MSRHFIFNVLLVSVFTFSISTSAHAEKVSSETLNYLSLFGDVFERVRADYVEETKDKQLIEAAINGMLTDLDPHSAYLDEEAYKDMQVKTVGEFGGLGIEVTLKNGFVFIVSPIDDTPAFKAGLKAGDYITHIYDEAVLGMTLEEAVKKMRGEVGSKITLTIAREGKDPFQVTMIRESIQIRSIRARAEKDVAYVRVTSFAEPTADDLIREYNKVKKEIGEKNLKGIVLDLRNNPGGLLGAAIDVSDAFLDRGEIVMTKGRAADDVKRYSSTKGDIAGGLPIVVIINEGSASAAEIVAGALQDHRRALVIGEKSFGKGSVQTVIPLPGKGAMRLTTRLYYTPSGRSIQAKGIEPDIEVRPAKLEYLEEKMKSTEANLRGHLDNKDEKDKPANDNKSNEKSATSSSSSGASKSNSGASISPFTKEEDKKEEEVDYQLERAFDLIRGIYLYGKSTAGQTAL